MAVSYSTNLVTIDGSFADGAASVSGSTLTRISGTASNANWIGRLIAFYPSTTTSTNTQVRLVTAVSGNNITVHSSWRNLGGLTGTFRVAHNCQDVHDIGNAALSKIGDSTFQWDADWTVINSGFFGDTDISLEMRKSVLGGAGIGWNADSGAVIQFGLLWGGEKNDSVETTNGCSIFFNKTNSGTNSFYKNTDSRDDNGAVFNYYGSLIQSKNPTSSAWSFQRMRGPMRFIGCSFDGPMGGRFYHEATEWAQCRMAGNDNPTPAWSLGATFTRPVSDVIFFQNGTVLKNFLAFAGTFRDTVFTSSNGLVFSDSGTGQINFIDCTTFATTSGDAHQFKSVNYTTTDSGGSALAGVSVRINAANDSSPTPVISNGSGVVPEILAEFQEANTNFGPFRIRIRKYGYVWASLNSSISDAIKQGVALGEDTLVTQSLAAALAHTGITIADTAPVTWNGLPFSITVTGNTSVNSGLTLTDIQHYLQAVLASNDGIGGKSGGLLWHDLIPMAGKSTVRAPYSAGNKGVRVIDQNGDPFPGVLTMQADNGSIYTPPITAQLTVRINQTLCDVFILAAGTDNVLASVDAQAGTDFVYQFTTLSTVDIGVIRPGFVPFYVRNYALQSGLSLLPVSISADRNYV